MRPLLSTLTGCALLLGAWTGAHAQNVSVHDPSVIKTDDTYYVFGSHLAAARSNDLVNWYRFAQGVNSANPLFNNVTVELAEALNWAETNTLWAADVTQLADGRYYMYYNACRGDSPLSAMGVAVADNIEGPYENIQVMLRSGRGQTPTGASYNGGIHPNVVDPHVFYGEEGRLWMAYGSYSGGLFILELDPNTGLILPGQNANDGYGTHLMGGNHSRIEAPYILYSPQSDYYYLFSSFGGLAANGGYDIRVARSRNPQGPYYDAAGNDMRTVRADCALDCGDDSIEGFAQKMMGGHLWDRKSGDPGSGIGTGYVAPGHNSAYYEASSQQYFNFFHTRFPQQGEMHQVRVHEMFLNNDDWLVAAPTPYRPYNGDKSIAESDVPGTYRMINHGKDITVGYQSATSVEINLNSNGSITGAVSGSWFHRGENLIQVQVDGQGTFEGALSYQYHQLLGRHTVTFSAQSQSGVSIWGIQHEASTEPPPNNGDNPVADGTYRIVPTHSGKALDTENCGSNTGTNARQWRWLDNDCQKWQVTATDSGYYRISPAHASGLALDVENIDTADGANVFLWEYWGGEGQQFRLESAGNGAYNIIARHSGKCLDIEGVDSADGANLIQWSCISGFENQQFRFEAVQ